MKLLYFMPILCAGAAPAHDFWIEPAVHPSSAEFYLKQGEDLKEGRDFPRSAEHLQRFRVWFPDYRSADVVGLENGVPAGQAIFENPGFYVASYESSRQQIELEAVKFEKYLLLHGYDDYVLERHRQGKAAEPARERYIRCAKTVIRLGTEVTFTDSARGMPIEIVLCSNPVLDGQIEAVVLREGKPVPNLLVHLRGREHPQLQAVRTDEHGSFRFAQIEGDFWMLTAVLIEPASDGAWESYWASYTFTR